MHRIIDIYSPFAKATAQTIQTIGFLRGSNKWVVASFAFVTLWLFLVYIRNNTKKTSFWSSERFFLSTIILGIFVLRLPVLAYTHIDSDESEWIVGAATFFNDPRFWLSVDGTTSGPLVKNKLVTWCFKWSLVRRLCQNSFDRLKNTKGTNGRS